MELKTYQAHSMAEALEKVKKELGSEAVILHTRTIKRGGVLGVGARSIVEITASRDPKALPAAERRAVAGPARGRSMDRSASTENPPALAWPRPPRNGVRTDASRNRVAPPRYAPTPPTSADGPLNNLAASMHEEMNEIRGMVRQLLNRPSLAASTASPVPSGPPPAEVPAELQDYYTRLLQQAVAEELARDIVARAKARLDECRQRIRAGVGDKLTDAQIEQRIGSKLRELIPAVMTECVERMLPAVRPVEIDVQGGPKVVALVGPTGVGKTTTIAKLAAHFSLRDKKRVGLITIDTYRIAAVDQLRAYADIMDLSLEVVFTPEELAAAVEKLRGCELILIDTSGRSHRDTHRLRDLSLFLDAARRVAGESKLPGESRRFEVQLLLSCTSHPDQLLDVAEKFAEVGIDGVVFTKLDEAVGLGVVLNVASRLKFHMSYLTTGQDVPDDIEVGHRRRIAELLLAGRPDRWPAEAAPAAAGPVDQLA